MGDVSDPYFSPFLPASHLPEVPFSMSINPTALRIRACFSRSPYLEVRVAVRARVAATAPETPALQSILLVYTMGTGNGKR
eukprot:COSAG04_NODE_11562_length_702_cov_0.757877_1_plen_80_part_10